MCLINESMKNIINESIKQIDIAKSLKNLYSECSKNPNNLSFWYPKIKECGFEIPKTCVIPLPFEMWKWLRSDNYSQEKITEFKNFILNYLEKENFNFKTKLFLKSGVFSDKFSFTNCKLEDINNIGVQFLKIYYSSMILGVDKTTELVVREFINSSPDRLTIYEGMPLNTEFRVFYDFDRKKIMGIFNYWDKETMLNSLTSNKGYSQCTVKKMAEDKEAFIKMNSKLENEFQDFKEIIADKITNNMAKVDLNGQWSIDIMKSEEKFYLIDMALACQSYYFNKLSKDIK